MRREPHTTAAVNAISDAIRALEGEDTVVSERLHTAQGFAMRADLDRRIRQSLENEGRVNPRLIREQRELDAEYPQDAA